MGRNDYHSASTEQSAAALLRHIYRGNVQDARLLLRDLPYVAETNVYTMAACGHAGSLARRLDERPELVDVPEEYTGWMPLHWALGSRLAQAEGRIAHGIHEVLELLLSRGVDPNQGYRKPQRVKEQPGGEREEPASERQEPAFSALYVAIAHGRNRDAVRLLLARGADPNDNESLYHAAEQESVAFLEELLAWGARCSGTKALQRALDFGRISHVRILLEAGCAPDEEPPGALQHAVLRGCDPEIIALLVQYGADPDLRDAQGRSIGRNAIRYGRIGVYQWLLDAGYAVPPAETDELFLACALGDISRARSIANDVAGLDRVLTPDDQAILAHAAWEGNLPMLRCMLEIGFPTNCAGADGGTPLHCAAYTGQALAVEILLDYDPPIENRNNDYGSTPLEWAIHGSLHWHGGPGTNHARVVQLLLDAGAIPPARAGGSPEVERVLKGAGVPVNLD